MKLKMISYWTTTAAVALERLAGGVTDLIHGRTSVVSGEPIVQILTHLGYPMYVLTILGVWKLPGGIVLLVPGFPRRKQMGICWRLLCLHGCGSIGRGPWPR